ncbi:phosphatidate cytidylyltransferase [Paenibacillus sp. HB172176]|uniref:phosphatidate cytidylyltransferase n=1 Tax=Paenibacillus sp. HB172176 TaxID=2493690 RepID=UPI001439706A|nr:phosphatidate cytidylyltransferase [Paenibacillus sp. HB172176]
MRQRLITGVLAGAIFFAITIAGGPLYTLLLVLLAIIGFSEYTRMNGVSPLQPSALLGYLGVLLFVLPWRAWEVEFPSALTIVWTLTFVLLALTVVSKNKTTIDGVALLLLGAIYVGFGFSAMIAVRGIESDGLFWTALSFGCIWASDVGAYFAGRAFGRRKMWPSISPNKTVEGALGGVLLSLIVAVLFAVFSTDLIPLWKALLFGLVVAIAGQFGDLIQSAYKRIRNLKDTGTLLPGHGGVLDRCDSWLIVFPLLMVTDLVPI